MANLSKRITFYITILTFIIICLLGIIAEISWSVIFTRSISAALIIGCLTYATCFLIYNLVIKEFIQDPNSIAKFELIADEEININNLNDKINNQSLYEDSQTEKINSFTPTPIDSTIENIINQDPQKAADILRKMGLDE